MSAARTAYELRRLRQCVVMAGVDAMRRERGHSFADVAEATGVSAIEIEAKTRGVGHRLIGDDDLAALGAYGDVPLMVLEEGESGA